MIDVLAQTAPGPEAATQASHVIDWSLWEPTSHEVLRASMLSIGTLVAGVILLVLLRGWLLRVKLARVLVVSTLATAGFLAVAGLKPLRAMNPVDPIGYILPRVYVGIMLFVALRVVDRLIIVPLLSRGGKVTMPRFFHQMVNIVLAFFATLAFGATAFGWDINGFLAGSAVVSIVVGLALQESLGNLMSGLVMHASPPFAIGDWIVCGEHQGRVVDMTWRAVTLHTNDDNFVVVPNGTVAKADIVNFHAPTISTARRVTVGLEYDVVPAHAIAVMKAAALEAPGVDAKPEPFVYLENFGNTSVDYVVKFWINEPSNFKKIEHAVRLQLWYRLREAGIEIPNPVYIVEHVDKASKVKELRDAATQRFVQAIESVPLLQPLSDEQKRELAASANDVLLLDGQVLFRQNDMGDSFYIVCKGQVDVLAAPEGQKEERKVATLAAGQFFGEMSALTGQPRTATIKASAPTTLVKIEKQDLHAIFKADPSIMEKISEIVAKRNAERIAIMQGPGAATVQETVAQEKKTLLGRMMKFFRLGNAA